MTAMAAHVPGPAHTTTGAPLPLVALPQTELLTVNEKDIPLVRDTLGPGVHVKPLRLDIEKGEWVVLATFSPGATEDSILTAAPGNRAPSGVWAVTVALRIRVP